MHHSMIRVAVALLSFCAAACALPGCGSKDAPDKTEFTEQDKQQIEELNKQRVDEWGRKIK
jgi:hypothetical protein